MSAGRHTGPPVQGVPVSGMPVESTPLVGEEVPVSQRATAVGVPVEAQASFEGAAQQLRENGDKGSAGGSACCGFLGGIMCLLVYYLNDGPHAECSTPLPLFLKVNGFAGLAVLAGGGCLAGGLSANTQNVGIKAALGLVGAVVGGLPPLAPQYPPPKAHPPTHPPTPVQVASPASSLCGSSSGWPGSSRPGPMSATAGSVRRTPSNLRQGPGSHRLSLACATAADEGTKWYFVLIIVVPLAVCCCACSCACCIFAAKARESSRNAPVDSGLSGSGPSVAV